MVIKKVKFLKIKGCGTTFTILGGFRGGFVEGCAPVLEGEIDDL